MKTSTVKKSGIMLCMALFAVAVSASVTHGSIKGTATPMYAQGTTGGNLASLNAAATLDYKVVTKGSKTWAYLKFNGTSGINSGATWQTQLRYWTSANGKTENNMTGFVSSASKVIWGTTTKTIPNPLKISFFQDLATGGFSETALIPYDIALKNSPVTGDVTPPTVTSCDAAATETTAALTLSGTDDSGDLYYYVADAAHGVEEFVLGTNYTVTGLSASTTYNLTITPIDFNGNEGTPIQKTFTTGGLVQVTYGVAKDIKFRFKSSTTQFEYYYEPVDPTKKLRDAFIKITPSGGTEFEIKPTLSPDSTYAYGISTDANIASKILTLNCGYWIAPGLPDYSDYVVTNTAVTAGDLTGTAIKHMMGGAIQPSQAETTAPALTGVSLLDVNSGYAKLNINGSDNSGAVYYAITGGKQDVNTFRTGNYYLTSIDPGKVYTLNIQAKDFSGNVSTAIQQKVKTMNARTNLLDGTLMKYNSTIISSTGAVNELASNIQVVGNAITLGCNTTQTGLTGTALNRKFFNAAVRINGTSYPLTLATPDSTSAQVTFTNLIGTLPIATGTSFTIQFSVFWTKGAGNFVTGIFAFTIGDNGQVDVEGPTTPQLHLNGNNLTWPACTDALSGVKWYIIAETGQPIAKIFDFGETNFSYTMANPTNTVTVTAVDFIGNATPTQNIISANKELQLTHMALYPNPATDKVYISGDVARVAFYSLQGQLILSKQNANVVDISTLNKGSYIVRLTDKTGSQNSLKLEIR
ncbi:MAG: T9SS type A sorting domain-containing protein [Paludibacter sp.]|nr:T9SS type A sorting domain-containing protein [Paludibacter sp.]